jgi:nucleoside-diphosphate-sugar epimerase
MKVLVVGGSGYVGRLTMPYVAERFSLRIYDRVPPSNPDWEFIQGDVTDPTALAAACEGVDVLLYMAMGTNRGNPGINDPVPAYDVNVKGLHLALDAAVRAGVRHAVYTSTLSVYDGHLDITSGATDREEVPAEPRSLYGFTKLMGEEVCRFIHRKYDFPIFVLRLFMPVSQEQWHAQHNQQTRVDCRTSAPDLARAFIAAIAHDRPGFEIIHITGDYTGRAYHHEKAKRLLHWEPQERL